MYQQNARQKPLQIYKQTLGIQSSSENGNGTYE